MVWRYQDKYIMDGEVESIKRKEEDNIRFIDVIKEDVQKR